MSSDELAPASQNVQEEIRKEKLSTYNRLHSIHEDSQFVSRVAKIYRGLPVIANQRCGSWYVDPAIGSMEFAYFKSTDGHFGRWDFNLRRSNLHLIPVIERYCGIVLVDSTRRGKRYSDALSKTVPIWCAVINAAMKTRHNLVNWDSSLYTTPKAVSRSEHSQIEGKIAEWAAILNASSFSLPRISKPIRPLWITPDSQLSMINLTDLDFFPVVCLSASKLVEDVGGVERRLGYTYVQGSGDDHELWSKGLNPSVFWEHASELLASDPTSIHDLVRSLLQPAVPDRSVSKPPVRLTPIMAVKSQIYIGRYQGATAPSLPHPCTLMIYISVTSGPNSLSHPESESSLTPPILHLTLPPGKRGQTIFLKHILPLSIAFAQHHLRKAEDPSALAIVCSDGTDISVGVAIAIMQVLFDEQGDFFEGPSSPTFVTKASLRTKLQWIQSSQSDANPSRTTLKRVNEFFMSNSFTPVIDQLVQCE